MTEDFKPYLDAVIKSGDRTRNFIYVMVLINFCVLAATLNGVAPNWDDTRLDTLDIALNCSISKRTDGACATALEYANTRGFHNLIDQSDSLTNQETVRQLRVRIDRYQQRDVDENSFNIPLFNVPLDVNDLWILSGLLNCYVMFFVVACLDREHEDLVLATARAKENKDLELLMASQILAKSVDQLWRIPLDKIFKLSIVIAPSLFHIIVCYKFFRAYRVLYDLIGMASAWTILTLCTVTLLVLLRFSWRAVRKARQIDRTVTVLEAKCEDVAHLS
jgi:hypothetical protein